MTKEEIAKLPTLLDILQHYWDGEKQIEERTSQTEFRGLFPTRTHKGYFEPILMEDGLHILLPLSPAQHSYYRGESAYHEECYPSLYRKGMTEADIFVERVKRCELELMMQQYPVTELFANSIQAQAPDGNWQQIPFRIGYDGMAQHYGIRTEFMDMTVDPLIAAFFAATTYDYATDTYSPITDIATYPFGVFYLYNEISLPVPTYQRIDVVGMQPLLRPGRQSAFVFRMNRGENFDCMAQKTFFRHDAEINRQIYQMANQNGYLFPEEILNKKIRFEIVEGDEFSQLAYETALQRYASNENVFTIQRYLEEKKISITIANREWFTDGEKSEAIEYWNSNQNELFSKIIVRWSYRGPIIKGF